MIFQALATTGVTLGLVINGCAPTELQPRYHTAEIGTYEPATTAIVTEISDALVIEQTTEVTTTEVVPQGTDGTNTVLHATRCYITDAVNKAHSTLGNVLYRFYIKVRWCTDGIRVSGVEVRQVYGDGSWGWSYDHEIQRFGYFGNGFLSTPCEGCYAVFTQGKFNISGQGWFMSDTPTIWLVFDSNDLFSPCGGPGGCPIVYWKMT